MTLGIFAQKAQRIAYIDMEYILENIPDYQTAKSQLDQKVVKWQENITEKQNEIDRMKSDLSNERALLTSDLILEREEDISIKVDELKKLQNKYFSTKGDLFMLRQQLVKPIQDQVFNAIQEIAVNRAYDFVLDKSSDLIMLYSNDKYDISDMIIKSITRTEKQNDLKEKQAKFNSSKEQNIDPQLSEDAIAKQEVMDEKKAEQEVKKQEMQSKIEAQKEERAKQREEQLKAIEESRKKKLLEREKARKKLEEKKAADQKAREEKQN